MTIRRDNEGGFASGDDDLVREVLRFFVVDAHLLSIDCPFHARGFSGAVIRRVAATEGLDFSGLSGNLMTGCLRGWPPRGLPAARLWELHRFLRFLQHRGIAVVPVPIGATNGETLVSHRGRDWQFERWMPGTADFHHSSSESRLNSVMTTLARLHCAAAHYRPTAAGREWFAGGMSAPSPAVDQRLAILNRWTADRLATAAATISRDADMRFSEVAGMLIERFRRLHEPAKASLMQLRHTSVPLQVCLRDVWHDHVLFTGDVVSGIVDPSAARTESVASDLSRLLGSLLGKPSDRWKTALEAYHTVRPLSREEHRLIRALQLSGALLSGMTWVDRRTRGEIPAAFVPDVTARLEGFVAQLDD